MKIELELTVNEVIVVKKMLIDALVTGSLVQHTKNKVLDQIDKQLPPVKQSLASGPRNPQDPTVKS